MAAELADWMNAARARLSPHDEAAKAMNYMLNRWPAFTRFLNDGRICLTNNAAERALRGIAFGSQVVALCGFGSGGTKGCKNV